MWLYNAQAKKLMTYIQSAMISMCDVAIIAVRL